MLFEPYQDELQFIEQIHKYNEREYTVIRLTDTMLSKSIIDANVFVQDVLKKYGLMDYQSLKRVRRKSWMQCCILVKKNLKQRCHAIVLMLEGMKDFGFMGANLKKVSILAI